MKYLETLYQEIAKKEEEIAELKAFFMKTNPTELHDKNNSYSQEFLVYLAHLKAKAEKMMVLDKESLATNRVNYHQKLVKLKAYKTKRGNDQTTTIADLKKLQLNVGKEGVVPPESQTGLEKIIELVINQYPNDKKQILKAKLDTLDFKSKIEECIKILESQLKYIANLEKEIHQLKQTLNKEKEFFNSHFKSLKKQHHEVIKKVEILKKLKAKAAAVLSSKNASKEGLNKAKTVIQTIDGLLGKIEQNVQRNENFIHQLQKDLEQARKGVAQAKVIKAEPEKILGPDFVWDPNGILSSKK